MSQDHGTSGGHPHGPGHGHPHGSGSGSESDEPIDVMLMWKQEYWDERYRTAPTMWSGNPNPRLVEYVSRLEPGAALDVGCGEGADAIWLASHGWSVTGMDVSAVALERAAAAAAAAGPEVAAAITWQQGDIAEWQPGESRYDLVSAQFMHFPAVLRDDVHRRLAAAVRPGGKLLVVAHHVSDLDTTASRWRIAGMFFSTAEVVAVLDHQAWRFDVAGAVERTALDPDGTEITVTDTVVLATRLS